MQTALVYRHVAFEDLGSFGPALAAAGYAVTYRDIGLDRLHEDDPLSTDLLVVLGGPVGAYDDERFPFLRHELRALEKRLAAGLPTLGICLGAQLIARAAGARVYRAPAKEIGFERIELTDAGRCSCLAPLAEDSTILHWHGDTFDLPKGATRLASTQLCENQAFSLGSKVIAFQFHPEATARGFERWLVGHVCELDAAGIDIARLRDDAAAYAPGVEARGREILSRWLAGLWT